MQTVPSSPPRSKQWQVVSRVLARARGAIKVFDLQVIERANDSEYGLASGVFSENLDEVNIISRGLKAGTVW